MNSSIYSKEVTELVCLTRTAGIIFAPWFLIHLKSSNIDNHLRKLEYKPSIGNQPWIFIGRTDAEAETPILWPPDAQSWLLGKDSDAGKDWGQEEKGMTDDENPRASAEDMGLIPGPGKFHTPLCNEVCAPQLKLTCHRAHGLTRETRAMRSLHTLRNSSPCSPQLEEALSLQQSPSALKK